MLPMQYLVQIQDLVYICPTILYEDEDNSRKI